ncbi:RNA ligase family protein [Evansella sp. AB-rgal1]|uniref:ATP-dependent DNA ligase n=1 Tax=Evansella sp. AB-rgal1 TaxID=3242696 RepID=UPI00359DEE00
MIIKPIYPFEPVSSSSVPSGEDWISQIKWDGTRILTYFDGKEVKLYNRKHNERTMHYPELTDVTSYCKAKSVILDGEVIALGKNGQPSFHEVMRRDAIRRMDRVPQLMKTVPVYYMIFDIVFYNNKWVNEKPLNERMELLKKVVTPNKQVQLTTIHEDGETLFEVTKEKGMEGIVSKNIRSIYKLKGKDDNWQKIKNFQDVIAVVGGVTYRNSTVNSLLLGLYDENGTFYYVGHAGTGKLTQNDWRTITTFVEALITDERPFANEPERLNGTKWIEPKLTVKIKYIEWPEGRSIRQPSIQAFVDVPPKECILPN